MSAAGGIKRQLMEERRLGNPHYSNAPGDRPISEYIRTEVRKEGSGDAGFQCFPGSDSEKVAATSSSEGDKKTKKQGGRSAKVIKSLLHPYDDPRDTEVEAEDEEDGKTPWKGPKLEIPYAVQNLDEVIKSFKADNILFDGGESEVGKKSQKNLFNWLEEYSRIEHKKKKELENQVFG